MVAFNIAWPGVTPRSIDIWHMGGGVAFAEDAVTPDGALALGEAYVPGSSGRYVGPASVDRRTGKMTVLFTFPNPLAQVVSIAGDSNWIAWIQGSNQPNLEDWALYSYNRATGAVRQLAAAPKPDGVHYPNTQYILISMSHGVIVWSAIEGMDSVYHVYAITADGTGGRTLAANARGPQIIWPWVMYNTKPTQPGISDQLQLQSLESGEIRDIAGPTSVSYFAYDGSSVAWIPEDNRDLYLMAPIGTTPIHIVSANYMQFVSMNARLVGWGQDIGAVAYDRELHIVVRLSDLNNSSPILSDSALDWLFQPNQGASNPFANTVQNQIDIRQLP